MLLAPSTLRQFIVKNIEIDARERERERETGGKMKMVNCDLFFEITRLRLS